MGQASAQAGMKVRILLARPITGDGVMENALVVMSLRNDRKIIYELRPLVSLHALVKPR